MKKLNKAKALKMTKDERREYMIDLKQHLKEGKITRAEFDAAREPIRAAVISEMF